ncbi:MAG: type II secretion system protein [Candidatus Saccharibacteria bacterium]
MSANKLRRSQGGFTLVEVTVAVSVMAIVGVLFLSVVTNYFVIIARNSKLSELTLTSQNLLRTTVENIRFGDGVRQTNSNPDVNAPVGGWNTSNTNFVIILAVPAVDTSHNYIIDPATGSPYMNELVYYKNGTTLMKRTLANPGASGTTLKTSCPAALANASCPADTQLASYVSAMTFKLYDQDAVLTTTSSLARSVNITLTMQRNNPGDPITVTNSIQVTLRNRF